MAQLTYARTYDVGFEGMKCDTREDNVVVRRNAEASATIPMGRFVKKGTGDEDALIMTSSADVIEGITVHSHAADVDTNGAYNVKAPMSIMQEGAVWMKTEEAVTPADPVYVRYAAGGAGSTARGTVRKSADTAGAVLVRGARFESTASANGLVRVYYSKKVQYGVAGLT
jgi:hypothetical protein